MSAVEAIDKRIAYLNTLLKDPTCKKFYNDFKERIDELEYIRPTIARLTNTTGEICYPEA